MVNPEDDYFDDYEEEDELEEAMSECGSFESGGYIVCSMIGSEHCDFDCPFRKDLGKRCGPRK